MKYYNIVFVTHNKGNGGGSKFNCLDRLFGRDNFSYIVTREKHLVRMDYIIDDRNDFLNSCAENGITSIRIKTYHKQLEDAHPHVIEMDNWYEIHDFLINRYGDYEKKAS
jgi:5'(3')-deoxyribonucleotidase